MPVFGHGALHALTRAVCAAGGSAPREAELVADNLVAANLAGHDSHGIGMLPFYVRSLSNRSLLPNRHAELTLDRGPVLVVEGQRGYGQVIGFETMQLGMARAAETGVALVAIRNSFHLCRIGHWAEQCAAAGFASVHFVNGVDHAPLQAPYGGRDARFSTNPFCAAVPGEGGAHIVLDMATSKIAFGKARVAANKGEPVPDGSLLDPDGNVTRDGAVMFRQPRGTMIPIGEHKGSGLAIMCELLAGALTGGLTNQPEHPQAGGTINNMLSVIIAPDALGQRDAVRREIGAAVAWIRSARPRAGFDEVLLPGEPERRQRVARLAHGIEIDPQSWSEIRAAALAAGVPDRDLDRLVG
jgi:hydroxycarboxylate dehydrogenase B